MSEAVNHLQGLPTVAASDVKKRGWKGIMRLLGAQGPVVVTNHDRPDAVIVSTAEYGRLRSVALQQSRRLDTAEEVLRAQWQRRLAWLNEPDAGECLRSVAGGPLTLNGEVKAGEGW